MSPMNARARSARVGLQGSVVQPCSEERALVGSAVCRALVEVRVLVDSASVSSARCMTRIVQSGGSRVVSDAVGA